MERSEIRGGLIEIVLPDCFAHARAIFARFFLSRFVLVVPRGRALLQATSNVGIFLIFSPSSCCA